MKAFVPIALISGIAFIATSVFGRDADFPQTSEIPVEEVLETEGVLDVEPVSPEPDQVEDWQQEILAHLDRWMGETLSSSGWLHVVTFHDREKDQSSSLSSGQIIPEDYIKDTWYFLNEEGLVSEMVTFMTDLEGNIIQESTFSKGIWRNLTIGENWPGDPYEIRLDFGFSKDIARASKTSVFIDHYTSELDGVPVDVYTIEDIFDEPVHMEGFDKAIVSGSRTVYFDSSSGALLKAERTLTAENGTIYNVETAKFVTVEQVDAPPDDILDYLGE